MAPTWEQLAKVRNIEYDLDYWKRLRALYAGGKRLVRDPATLRSLVQQHEGEEARVYEKRLKAVCYVNYFGQLVDYIVAAIGTSPVELKYEAPGTPRQQRGQPRKPESDFKVDDFYNRLFQDVTPNHKRKVSFNQHLRCLLLDALQVRDSWTLVELPEKGDREIRTLADEEAAGMRDAYLCHVSAEQVVDWQEDDDGELEWALLCNQYLRRESLDSKRDLIHDVYTYYDRVGWQRWGFEYKIVDGQPQTPADSVQANDEGAGSHSFGKVPLLRFCLPEGLWAGNKVANLAESHLNKRSAFDWGQRNTLFQFLAAMLDKPSPLNPATEDPKRGVKQPVGPGRVWVGGATDKIEYVSPDAEPYKVALQDMSDLRDEMMRVMHHMALSTDNSAASLKRSGDSKKQDAAATAVVLKGLGEYLRDHAEEIIELVARGRKEYGKFEVEAQGADEFDDVALDQLVEEAALVKTQVKIPSAHFNKRYDLKVAKRLLGTDLTEDDVETIRDELDETVTNESMAAMANPLAMLPGENGAPPAAEPDDDAPPPAKTKKFKKSPKT